MRNSQVLKATFGKERQFNKVETASEGKEQLKKIFDREEFDPGSG